MLTVKPIEDVQAITALYRAPEFSGLAHDHRPVAPIFHPAAAYLGAYVHGALAGLFLIIKTSAIEVDFHVLILRKFIRYARDLGKQSVDWIFANHPIHRITGYVVEGMESAKNYGLKLGFQVEGIRRDACMKGGQLKSVYTLGITRKGWAA